MTFMTKWSENESRMRFNEIQSRLLFLAFPGRVWSPILNYATSLRVRERIDRERATELAILEWVVSLCEIQKATGNMFLVENPVQAPRAGIKPQSKDFGTLPSRLKAFHICAGSGSRIRGGKEPSGDPSGI